MAAVKKKTEEIELYPDAWERFERAVKVVAKSPPQHRTKTSTARKAKSAKPKDRGAASSKSKNA